MNIQAMTAASARQAAKLNTVIIEGSAIDFIIIVILLRKISS
jgi:hypothetical protein